MTTPPPPQQGPYRYILIGKSNNNTVQTVTGYLLDVVDKNFDDWRFTPFNSGPVDLYWFMTVV